MASGLAHEIRNPLAALEVLGGLLERQLDDAESKELLQEMLTEQRRIGAAVDACLDFARAPHFERERLSVAGLLASVAERAQRRVAFAGAVEVEEEGPLVASVDRASLGQALLDLAVNALQALSESGTRAPRLDLRAESTPDGGVTFTVADNGPGVAPELRERIFHPFFTSRAQGTGVGLAQVQRVVTGHGGTIQVEGRPGGGAVFRLHLPGSEA